MACLLGVSLLLFSVSARDEPCVPVKLEAQESLAAENIKTGVWGYAVDGVESTNVYRRVTTDLMTSAGTTITAGRSCLKSGRSVETYAFNYRNDQVVWNPRTGCPHVNNSQSVFGGTNIFTHGEDMCITTFENGNWIGDDCSGYSCPVPLERNPCGTKVTETSLELCWAYESEVSVYQETVQQTLDLLYTTAELIQQTRTKVMDAALYPYPEAWLDGAARLRLTCEERVATATRMRYRLGFQTRRDVRYRVRWEEVAIYDDGTISRTPQIRYVEGTGEYIYLFRELPPPGKPGTIHAQLGTDGGAEIVRTALDTSTAAAPGSGGPDNGCAQCGTPAATLSSGPRFALSLGQSGSGPVGELEIGADRPTPGLATPALLSLNSDLPELEVVRDSVTGYLRQVVGPQTIADIVVINPFRFEVRFYLTSQAGPPGANGLRSIVPGAQPFAVWIFENPDSSATSLVRWKVTEIQNNAVSHIFLAEYDEATGSWRMTEQHPSGGGLRIDETTRQFRLVNGVGYTDETSVVRWPDEKEAYRVRRTYRHHERGLFLVEEQVGPESDPETTRYEYGFDAAPSWGVPLLRKTGPGAYWERYAYDSLGRLSMRVSPIGNAPPSAPVETSSVTLFDYTSVGDGSGDDPALQPNFPRTTIELMNGVEMARRYHIFKAEEDWEVLCPDPYAMWDDERNMVLVTRRYVTGADRYRIRSIRHQDGTVSYYRYSESTDEQIVEVSTGEPNPTVEVLWNGRRVVTVRDPLTGAIASQITHQVVNGLAVAIVASELHSLPDPFGKGRRVTYLDGTYSETQSGCCGSEWMVDRDGVKTTFSYDGLKRLVGTTRLGISEVRRLDPIGRRVASMRTGTDGSMILLGETLYDSAGRIIRETNALRGVTIHERELDASGNQLSVVTYPDDGTRIEAQQADGALAYIVGSAVAPVRFEAGMEFDEGFYRRYLKEIKLDEQGNDTPEWSKLYKDGLGRAYKTVYPGGVPAVARSDFNGKGQLVRTVDPDGVATLLQYDPLGRPEYTCIDSNRNDRIDFDGRDRISRTTVDFVANHGAFVHRTTRMMWGRDGVDTGTVISTHEVSADGRSTWFTTARGVSVTTMEIPAAANNWTRKLTQRQPDGTTTIELLREGRPVFLGRYDSLNNQIAGRTHDYDAHGRVRRIVDANNGATTFFYDSADHVSKVVTPSPGNGQPEQTTETIYDASLRPVLILKPDGRRIVYEYYPTGLLKETSGAQRYPARYTYDAQGRLTLMTTWQDHSRNAGAATTAWRYDPTRGWLEAKFYSDEFGDPFQDGPRFSYTPAGRIQSRTWARGVTVTFEYNNAGEPSGVHYDDGLTADTVLHRDRLGRPALVERAGATSRLQFDSFDQMSSEEQVGGPLDGLRLHLALDDRARVQSVSVRRGPSLLTEETFSYDVASRLESVVAGGTTVRHGYPAYSTLPDGLVFEQSGKRQMTIRRQTDGLNRLTFVTSEPYGDAITGFSYLYDEGSRRIRSDLSDGTFWVYRYDSLGQLKEGRRHWDDGTPVAGQQFAYRHDDIGNRQSVTMGGAGAGAGANPREAAYVVNLANQYVARTVPGAVDIIGAARATASVTVNDRPVTARKGEYFWSEVSAESATESRTDPLWLEINVRAAEGTNTQSATGNLYVPESPEALTYDADGNLLSDSRWRYQWDGENRLVRMTTRSPVGPEQRLEFEYDWRGRRISKKVWSNTAGQGVPVRTQTFVHHGWRLVLVLDGNGLPEQSFHWGNDLSGTRDGAGGIGGLLSTTIHVGTNAGTYYFAYDGNGNVVALASASDGAWVARYEYGPFGELIRASGRLARENSIRFSTKWQDEETDLIYYGYRFYSPGLGRWINRDPIAESGDLNVYAWVGNDPVSNLDPDGRVVHYAFTEVDWKYHFDPMLWWASWFYVGGTRNATQIDSQDCCHLNYRGFTDYSTPEYADKYTGNLFRIRHSFATAASAAISSGACTCRGKRVDGLELTVHHVYRSQETVALQLSGGVDVGLGNDDTGNITGKLGVNVTIPPASEQSTVVFKYLVCPTGDAGNVPTLRTIALTPLLQRIHALHNTVSPYWSELTGWTPPSPPDN